MKILRYLNLFVGILLFTFGSGCALFETVPTRRASTGNAVQTATPEQSEMDEERRLRREQQLQRALNEANLIPGMSTQEVRAAWGEPREIDSAGDPRLGNEKWTYYNGLSSRWSISSTRIVYFEAGKVVGWRSQ
ncbi:MAG TPA: hypothetical protein VJB59_04120 [Bdellovibrionota bacterium]|nr:hypothetical protein [Bdellovibrionota bacterium]